ncbi:helix-turn-helix domain-containing protein [Rathayibacter sp. VKM Ac-2803]|uniref:helix-turn-helix transcriptional regulator n=1 Tax=Rathayibacter sp. VKM Ac-2803 TaxID=2609256 RepID=UPI00135CC1D8|nr:AraC family transcriptional regulator [Rathayibacter sp. VKM Ac-2803]MWV50718.1 helix-turn-helix domain-containing protein [Rathayibacter sp. VKM Ac-2803]
MQAYGQPLVTSVTDDGVRHSLTREPWLLTTQALTSRTHEAWTDGVHDEHELIYSESGVLTVEVEGRLWATPHGLGIWIPAGTTHHVTAEPGTSFSVTYLSADRVVVPWSGTTGIGISAVVREMLLANKTTILDDGVRLRLQRLIVDLLNPVRSAALDVRMPTHPALRAVAEQIVANPADSGTTADWGRVIGVSGRTVNRGFERETGASLTQWRILVRMRRALVDIAAGRSVISVARDVGYTNSSTFIQLFRQATGLTPAAYFRSFGVSGFDLDAPPLDRED